MEINTGASKTVLNEATYDGLRDVLGPLRKTEAVLSTYTGEAIPVAGEIIVPVKYGSQQENLKALVVKGKAPNLLGRDWLGVILLDWNKILQITSDKRSSLPDVLSKYPDAFADGLGTLKGVQAKIYVHSDAKPKYFKARPVPYAMKRNLEFELERLERERIISPVYFRNGRRRSYQ